MTHAEQRAKLVEMMARTICKVHGLCPDCPALRWDSSAQANMEQEFPNWHDFKKEGEAILMAMYGQYFINAAEITDGLLCNDPNIIGAFKVIATAGDLTKPEWK
jgi:hypothetical protein